MTRINYQLDDATLYAKAKIRVLSRLVITYILLVAYFIGSYYLLHFDFFSITSTKISNMFLFLMIGAQLILYLILFLMLSTGSKIFRVFYWICFVFEIGLLTIPAMYIVEDITNFFAYACLLLCMFVKLIILYALGHSLQHNAWSRIFFDRIIEIDEDQQEEDEIFQPIQKTQRIPKDVHPEPVQEIPEEEYEEEPYTLPQVSIRLGICVYASLMVFPILVQIFSSFFVSNDLQSVFATKDIFILAIVSAVIWTIPIFFMYYEHPMSKRIVAGCVLAECIAFCAYLPSFIGYISSGEYPIRVFILFILVDALRYVALWYSLKPLSTIH